MTDKKPSGGVVCHYCHDPGHVHQDYRKLKNRYRRFPYVHESLKGVSTHNTMLIESGKPNTCLISSSSKRVIDSEATDHMTSNSNLLTTFQPHPSISTVTLADRSTSCVLGSRTIHSTSLITLTYVLSLPQFSFNLISVSKLTRTLNCSISFFPDYCFIQDLLTKRIISRGRESEGLYILETKVPKSVACFGVVTPFELHCRLDHPFPSLLKKLYPQFSSLSSLNCESCQYAKLHRVHLSPRVNNRAFASFDLVHSYVWGLCPVVSLIRVSIFCYVCL